MGTFRITRNKEDLAVRGRERESAGGKKERERFREGWREKETSHISLHEEFLPVWH